MKDAIIRLLWDKEDAEVLICEDEKEYFKTIAKDELFNLMQSFLKNEANTKPMYIDENIFAYSRGLVGIKQPEHQRIVTYQGKAYNIHFPNAAYLISFSDEIKNIQAYAYKHWIGPETVLYHYPMPNMLASNSICIGSAPRQIKGTNITAALENIIFTQYTHSTVDGKVKSFNSTKDWFEYLQEHEFPYSLLVPVNKKVGDICAKGYQ